MSCNLPKTMERVSGFFKMFVKNTVDGVHKSGYDKDRNITCYAKLFNLTWYRKGELYHVYTGNHRE